MKKDIVYITGKKGDLWQYKDGGLRDKNGKLYATIQQTVAQPGIIQQAENQKIKNQDVMRKESLKQLQSEAKRK
ncbi:hypothetical protein [Aneurinibacillus tyrosinisolvens]|uniref:hypothetical protein n=1 Tax=Aneurinibacillus tyrosinisolvens TaxID=1443435 RepID=UPI00128E1256|nr:hypothetical protein [Aneurinibacillus tyrosinisolvens]